MKISCLFALVALLAGCASVSSTKIVSDSEVEGAVYYLPKRDVLITVEVASDKKVSKITIASTDPYPDVTTPYLLKHEFGMFSKNDTNISVKNGLLSTAVSENTSQVIEIGGALGGAIGTISPFLADLSSNAEEQDCATGAHHFSFEVSRNQVSYRKCGVVITIGGTAVPGAVSSADKPDLARAGVYYRVNLPYRVTAVYGGSPRVSEAALVFSPSLSTAQFLPFARSFFANAKADIALQDGTLTSYKQTTNSELLGLFQLPAAVIRPYFAAIGATFDSFKSNDEKEASALVAKAKLELAIKKYDACMEAIKKKDDELIRTLACNS